MKFDVHFHARLAENADGGALLDLELDCAVFQFAGFELLAQPFADAQALGLGFLVFVGAGSLAAEQQVQQALLHLRGGRLTDRFGHFLSNQRDG